MTYTENRVSKWIMIMNQMIMKVCMGVSHKEYDIESSVSHGFSSESEIDFDDLS